MATIDIRYKDEELINEIVFADDQFHDFFSATSLVQVDHQYIKMRDGDGITILVQKSSINNLIKALQKAQEIWKED